MSCPIGDIEGVDSGAAEKLKAAGIRTSDKLLCAAMSLRGRRMLSEKTGIDETPVFLGAPGIGIDLEVQLLPYAGHSERSEAQSVDPRGRERSVERSCGPTNRNGI